MTFIKEILEKYPDAGYWHQQYPWFATGKLIDSYNKKDTLTFEVAAQKAALFFNNIPRLHWLLHQADLDGLQLIHTEPAVAQQEKEQPLPVLAAQNLTEPTYNLDLSAETGNEEEETEVKEENDELLTNSHFTTSLADVANSFKNQPATNDELTYQEAYQHTIDYFASQGIKLDAEPANDDRFGQQLKTFTSWLRQMKPLMTTDTTEAEALVEQNAAHSLQKGDVLTEPMADILLKQGKKAQAIQLLEKIRLLHPEKSLYFAARIDQIKNLK